MQGADASDTWKATWEWFIKCVTFISFLIIIITSTNNQHNSQ